MAKAGSGRSRDSSLAALVLGIPMRIVAVELGPACTIQLRPK